jgi:hypothetical protein
MKGPRGNKTKRNPGRGALLTEPKVNRGRMCVVHLKTAENDVGYWRSQSADARLAYMELLRQINYGQAATSGRLKRVLEIAELRPG